MRPEYREEPVGQGGGPLTRTETARARSRTRFNGAKRERCRASAIENVLARRTSGDLGHLYAATSHRAIAHPAEHSRAPAVLGRRSGWGLRGADRSGRRFGVEKDARWAALTPRCMSHDDDAIVVVYALNGAPCRRAGTSSSCPTRGASKSDSRSVARPGGGPGRCDVLTPGALTERGSD